MVPAVTRASRRPVRVTELDFTDAAHATEQLAVAAIGDRRASTPPPNADATTQPLARG